MAADYMSDETFIALAGVTPAEVEAIKAGFPEGLDYETFVTWAKQNESTVRLIHSGIDKTGAALCILGQMVEAVPIAMGMARLERAMVDAGLTV
jgi:hypothetical protein